MQGDIGADAGTGAAGHASATRNNCLSNLDQAFVLYLNETLMLSLLCKIPMNQDERI